MKSFVARQPILDRSQEAYGYELLFRTGLDNFFDHPDIDHASSKVLADSFILHGLETLTGGKRAFINISEQVLLNEWVQLFPPELTVVEVMETVEPTPAVVDTCRRLKKLGYTLALDDFVYDGRIHDLMDLADILKVDVLASNQEERAAMARRVAGSGKRLVAEKVETDEMFRETLELGYDLFQGYFFSKPTIVQAEDLRGYKLHHFEILQEVNRPDLDFDRIEEIFKREMSLCYKLLRYINSVFFGWRNRVTSVRRALVLLGEKELRKWASFIILASMAEDKPDELLIQSVVRARFCEALAPMAGFTGRSQDLFLMGMFSLIDAILDRSLQEILDQLPIAGDVRDALLGEDSEFNRILCYARGYERGAWSELERLTPQLDLPVEEVPSLYLDALEWGTRTFACSMAGDDERQAG